MRKPLITAVAFIASAIFGPVLLLIIVMLIGYVWMALSQHNQSGIGAVAGGISKAAVLLVPILCGIFGTLIVLRQLDRREP